MTNRKLSALKQNEYLTQDLKNELHQVSDKIHNEIICETTGKLRTTLKKTYAIL